MLVVDVADFNQNMTKVLNTALTDDVVIDRGNGMSYKLLPIGEDEKKSPWDDITGIDVDGGITADEIVLMIKEGRGWTKESLAEWRVWWKETYGDVDDD